MLLIMVLLNNFSMSLTLFALRQEYILLNMFNMKKIAHFVLLIVMLHSSFIANAHDFSLNGIYYNYTTGLEVEVAYGDVINNPL